MKGPATRYLIQIGIISLAYVLTQWYVAVFPNYDIGTFAVGAMIPLAVSIALPAASRSRVLLYASVAYFWALVDDGPVFLDSVLTWPEVTRFHPLAPHLFLEVLYHLLTAFFMVLAVREVVQRRRLGLGRAVAVALLVSLAFGLAYLQNAPIGLIQEIVETQWYQLDVVEHLLSAIVFSLGIIVGARAPLAVRPENSEDSPA